MNTKTALIGHTGFVGGNLARQAQFDDYFNSRTIDQIKSSQYDLLVCAGARAEKWKANREPEQDLININYLIGCLKTVKARRFILISTVDVYAMPQNVDEDTAIDQPNLSAYGLHRYKLEEFTRENFPSSIIVRLPGLFGHGLKKNFIYDMLHTNALHLTDADSRFQFYSLDDLWGDIEQVIANKIDLVNFATPPISARQVAEKCFDSSFSNKTRNGPVFYDMKTKHAHILSKTGDYIWDIEQEIANIKNYIARERKSHKA